MAKDRHTRVGVGVLIAYASLVSIAAVALYELGSRPLGYTSLTGLFTASSDQSADAQRYGHMWIHAERPGQCREYTLDNKKQQIILAGTVICDQQAYDQDTPGSRMQAIRNAFRGEH